MVLTTKIMDRFADKREAALQRRAVSQASFVYNQLSATLVETVLSEHQFEKWPVWAKSSVLNPRRPHNDRFTLFRFLVLNAVYPAEAVTICTWFNGKHSTFEPFTSKILKDYREMEEDASEPGSLKYYRFVKDPVYDVEKGRVLPGMSKTEYAAAYRAKAMVHTKYRVHF